MSLKLSSLHFKACYMSFYKPFKIVVINTFIYMLFIIDKKNNED